MELHKKLLQYSSLAFSFLILNKAEGEVVYTNIDPDTLIDQEWESFGIDMNDDSIVDFAVLRRSFSFLKPTSLSGYITSHFSALFAAPEVFGNLIAGTSNTFSASLGATTLYYPYALTEDVMIDESLGFQSSGYQLLAFRYRGISSSYLPTGGLWYPEILDRYLGVYFADTADCYHFGWIRCDVKNDGKELTVKDYAFELKCDTGIAAGDKIGDTTTVGISELNTLDASVYSFENVIFIKLNEANKEVQIRVYSLSGKEIYSDKIRNQFNKINLNVTKGVFFVELFAGESRYNKKIFLN